MQVKKYVETEFPGVPIIGETYPIAPHKVRFLSLPLNGDRFSSRAPINATLPT